LVAHKSFIPPPSFSKWGDPKSPPRTEKYFPRKNRSTGFFATGPVSSAVIYPFFLAASTYDGLFDLGSPRLIFGVFSASVRALDADVRLFALIALHNSATYSQRLKVRQRLDRCFECAKFAGNIHFSQAMHGKTPWNAAQVLQISITYKFFRTFDSCVGCFQFHGEEQ